MRTWRARARVRAFLRLDQVFGLTDFNGTLYRWMNINIEPNGTGGYLVNPLWETLKLSRYPKLRFGTAIEIVADRDR